MAKKGRKRHSPRTALMFVIATFAVVGAAFAYATGSHVNLATQFAVGAAADAMCMGGADAKCQCGQGLKAGKCDPNTKGGGKIGCPCKDETNGGKTNGKCGAVGKCKGEETGGMPPMLPMLPMMMPMMEMPKQPDCTQKQATTTGSTATSTAASSTSSVGQIEPSTDPNCPQGVGGSGGFDTSAYWYPNYSGSGGSGNSGAGGGDDFTTSDSSNAGSDSVWSRLLASLGLSSGDSGASGTGATGGITVNASGTGQIQSQQGDMNGGQFAVTADFASGKAGSTFTYTGSLPSNAAAGVLAQIAATLNNLLTIVRSWF